MNTNYEDAIRAARDLRSEHGENPEYDRALVELVRDLHGVDRETVAAAVLGDRSKA